MRDPVLEEPVLPEEDGVWLEPEPQRSVLQATSLHQGMSFRKRITGPTTFSSRGLSVYCFTTALSPDISLRSKMSQIPVKLAHSGC